LAVGAEGVVLSSVAGAAGTDALFAGMILSAADEVSVGSAADTGVVLSSVFGVAGTSALFSGVILSATVGAEGAAGAVFSVVIGAAGTAALFAGMILSATDEVLAVVYRYPNTKVFTINANASVKVSFARKPVGPFAPNTDSLLPLYAPRPMLELFCRSTAIVIASASTICMIKSVDVIYASLCCWIAH
jgi:hypothetical protein